MKQVKAHIAVSLDGHTATLDNELDWLPGEVKAIVGKYCLETDSLVEFLTEEPLRKVYELKQTHDILVVGGGKLLTSLVKAGLLDSLTIYTIPVMVGKGIGFIGETFGSKWRLSESKMLDNGVVCSTYLFEG